jgi:superfamily I DNA/RNA helicase
VPRTPVLGYRLFAHPAARLLRAYVGLVRHPAAAAGDQLRLLLNRPNRYLREVVVEDVASAVEPWARLLALAAAEPAAGPRPLTELAAVADHLRAALAGAADATSGDLVWSVVDSFGLEDWWRENASGGPSGAAAGDGDDPLRILDGVLLLAETTPAPGDFLAAWDRLLADEESGEDVADDTLEREEGAGDRVVIGTIHAAKGREYDAVVIPDYDCDVTRWEPAAIEEERRVVYVGVTRGRESVLLTVDTSHPYRHPFLRELVETPDAGESEALALWLDEAHGDGEAPELHERLARRFAELEVLYPELAPGPPGAPPGAAP